MLTPIYVLVHLNVITIFIFRLLFGPAFWQHQLPKVVVADIQAREHLAVVRGVAMWIAIVDSNVDKYR